MLMNKLIIFFLLCFSVVADLAAQKVKSSKPRILISTDIGGTDPDDNQSMAHLLMFNDLFTIEGLVSSPSYGDGSKQEILRMISLYELDYPELKKHNKEFLSPDALRALCKQGRKGAPPYKGYDVPTEGSDWIIECAQKNISQPLWVLVWGGLDDLAQALHDAPEIESKIKVYWIGGPNKKWGVNSYTYIAENFPNLWMIENNASYRGFIGDKNQNDKFNRFYYNEYIKGAGHLGKDFKSYYDGQIKMGDTPSLLYMMNGDPNNPFSESWGGSFERMHESPRTVFTRNTNVNDTVAVYSVVEFHFKGPKIDKKAGTPCFTFRIDNQNWKGDYLGNGIYGVKYAAKSPAILHYETSSEIKELDGLKGTFVVSELWPGSSTVDGYKLGNNWYTDKKDKNLFEGKWQGTKTVSKWRNKVLSDWGMRWNWLK